MENQEEFEFVEYKSCTKCKKGLPIDMFNWSNKSKGRRESECKVCGRKRHREYHKKNPEVGRIRARRNRHRNRQLVLDYMLEHPCINCGEADPLVLEFDHRDPSEKSFCISNACSRKRSLNVIKEEIKKCDVLCANCHRRKTAKQFRYFNYKVLHEGYKYNPKTYRELKAEMVE